LEQGFGSNQALSATYIGNSGRRLVSASWYLSPNPSFPGDTVYLYESRATSSYHALQIKYDRRLERGLQALASYTWAHAIDDVSDSTSNTLLHGNSDFDIRSAFTAAVSWTLPRPPQGISRDLLGGWALDWLAVVRSANPVNVIYGYNTLPDGTDSIIYPNLVPNQPVYLYGPQYPGGKELNPSAFTMPTEVQGDLGRNAARGFGLAQLDLSLRRVFDFTERAKLEAKIDAFNIFNHPDFFLGGNVTYSAGAATSTFASAEGNGGLNPLNSLYSLGGPRSLQLSLKLKF